MMNVVRQARPLRAADDALSPLAKRLGAFAELDMDDLAAIDALLSKISTFPRGTNLVEEGDTSTLVYILCEGWAARYRMLPDGKRQILNFAIPGDLVGVLLNVLSAARHSVCAVTDIKVASFPMSALDVLAREHPVVARAIHWAGVCEWAMLCEHLVSVGRRCATDRIAHLLLELQARLKLVDQVNGPAFALPITQEMIADCLGLTHVHVSRSLRKLSERGLLRYDRNRVVIVDHARLALESDFSAGYLDHHRVPMPRLEKCDRRSFR